MSALHWLSAVDLVRAYRNRSLSPLDVTRALLDRMNVLATDLLGLYRKLSYRMEVLEEGEQVAVLGTVAWVAVQGQPTLALVAEGGLYARLAALKFTDGG